MAGSQSGVEQRILRANPILEAFGNAQTVRNDNSSRFGKFMQLQYSGRARQLGAYIYTYLLERSRVINPPEGEANYHVSASIRPRRPPIPQAFASRQLAS